MLFSPAAMARAIEDLSKRCPKRFDQAGLLAEFKPHKAELRIATSVPASEAIIDFKRRVLLSNPAFDFDWILTVRRGAVKKLRIYNVGFRIIIQ